MLKEVKGDDERLVSGSARDRSTSGGQELAATGPLVAGHTPLLDPLRAQHPPSGPAPHSVLHGVVHQEDPPTDVRSDRDAPAVQLAGGNLRGLDEGVLPAVQLHLHGSGRRDRPGVAVHGLPPRFESMGTSVQVVAGDPPLRRSALPTNRGLLRGPGELLRGAVHGKVARGYALVRCRGVALVSAGCHVRRLHDGRVPAVLPGGRFTRQGAGGDLWRPPAPGADGRADRPTSSASGRIIGCRRGNRSWRWRRGGSQRRAWRRPITWPLPRGWPSWLREAARSTRPSPRT